MAPGVGDPPKGGCVGPRALRSCTTPDSPCPARANQRSPHREGALRWRPGPLRAPPARADHAVPAGAAACSEFLRPVRRGRRCQAAAIRPRRVRRLPGMRHPGPRLLAPALRGLRPRQAAGLQLQAPWLLPLVRGSAHVADRGASGGPRHPPCAGAPVGAVAADPAAPAAGRTAPAGDAGAAGGASCDHAPSARPGWAQGRGSRQRRRHADPAFWVGGQPQHTSALPGAGRGVPVRRRRRAGVRPSRCAHRRRTARAAAHGHRPADEDAHAPGRAGRGDGADLAGRAGRRRGRSAHPAATAGGSHHLPHRLRAARRAEGLDAARRDGALWSGARASVLRHRRQQ